MEGGRVTWFGIDFWVAKEKEGEIRDEKDTLSPCPRFMQQFGFDRQRCRLTHLFAGACLSPQKHPQKHPHSPSPEGKRADFMASFAFYSTVRDGDRKTLRRFHIYVVIFENCALPCQSRHHVCSITQRMCGSEQRVLTSEVSERSTSCRQHMARDLLNVSTRS